MASQRLKNYELIIRGKLLPTLCSFAFSKQVFWYLSKLLPFGSKLNDLLDTKWLDTK